MSEGGWVASESGLEGAEVVIRKVSMLARVGRDERVGRKVHIIR